ncbi:hypothetical protein [Pseudomonas sp. ATCC 13867]|uniref:hypothetical protein n=1 Tax=Pseudomonas sp. ATCC 13867 TaxID=1294143 RepID=UPI001F1AD639|nr:hypothetical protein [Pseudomonas sp. ATCC 13867]
MAADVVEYTDFAIVVRDDEQRLPGHLDRRASARLGKLMHETDEYPVPGEDFILFGAIKLFTGISILGKSWQNFSRFIGARQFTNTDNFFND